MFSITLPLCDPGEGLFSELLEHGGMIGIQRNLSYPSNAHLNPQDEHWSFPVPSEAGSGAQPFIDMIMNSQVHFVFH